MINKKNESIFALMYFYLYNGTYTKAIKPNNIKGCQMTNKTISIEALHNACDYLVSQNGRTYFIQDYDGYVLEDGGDEIEYEFGHDDELLQITQIEVCGKQRSAVIINGVTYTPYISRILEL